MYNFFGGILIGILITLIVIFVLLVEEDKNIKNTP